jgi:hypothetical protein
MKPIEPTEPKIPPAMTQKHQSAMKWASLVNESIALLHEIALATKKDFVHACKLRAALEELKNELQNVIDRAERKQLRRVIREKMKKHLAREGGGES